MPSSKTPRPSRHNLPSHRKTTILQVFWLKEQLHFVSGDACLLSFVSTWPPSTWSNRVLGLELRALHTLGKCSRTQLGLRSVWIVHVCQVWKTSAVGWNFFPFSRYFHFSLEVRDQIGILGSQFLSPTDLLWSKTNLTFLSLHCSAKSVGWDLQCCNEVSIKSG